MPNISLDRAMEKLSKDWGEKVWSDLWVFAVHTPNASHSNSEKKNWITKSEFNAREDELNSIFAFFQILRRHKCCTARIDDTAFSSRKKLLFRGFCSALSKWIFKDSQKDQVDSFQKTIKLDKIP